jgi:hypothetical protein
MPLPIYGRKLTAEQRLCHDGILERGVSGELSCTMPNEADQTWLDHAILRHAAPPLHRRTALIGNRTGVGSSRNGQHLPNALGLACSLFPICMSEASG